MVKARGEPRLAASEADGEGAEGLGADAGGEDAHGGAAEALGGREEDEGALHGGEAGLGCTHDHQDHGADAEPAGPDASATRSNGAIMTAEPNTVR